MADMGELIEQAEKLKHRMVWLANDIERDEADGKISSPRMKIQMFEGICSAFRKFSAATNDHQDRIEFDSIIQRQAINDAEKRVKHLEGELRRERQTLAQRSTEVQVEKAQLKAERKELGAERKQLGAERKQVADERATWIGGAFGELNLAANKTLSELGDLRKEVNVYSERAELKVQLKAALKETAVLRSQLEQARGKAEEMGRTVKELEDALRFSRNESTSLSGRLRESGTLLEQAREAGRTEKEKAERLEDAIDIATADKDEAERQLKVAINELQVLRPLQDQLSVLQNEYRKLTSDRDALDVKVRDLGAQWASLRDEKDSATSKAEELESQIVGLKKQVQELEDSKDAKVQLETQIDKAQEQHTDTPVNPVNSRKRPRPDEDEEEEEMPNPWGDDVVRLASFLHSCQPVLDADQSCSLDQAKIFIVLAALNATRLDNFLDFLTYAPDDTWFCFDELTEEGYAGGIAGINEGSDPQCARHANQDEGSCFQVRNCNEGGISYDRKFVCRIR
ncbi:hypothetical protein F4776DRAFT_657247 [Hypoxylon sp. NC0597]|nr:hypothetical protein F4776DRAFT_657247 [Hypoxylon sp. NC0597]